MSDTPSEKPLPPLPPLPPPGGRADASDSLLAALHQLPSVAMDGAPEARLHRQARAAYARGFEASVWHSPLAGSFGKAAVPGFLAGIVGLYMTWAIATATALVQ